MEQDPSLNNLVHAPGTETLPPGHLGHVEKRGHGPVPMVLISGGGFGWDVFEPLMEATAGEYTSWAVSLPGMGGTPPLPMPPEGTSYGEQTWTRSAVAAVLELIEREGLDRPLIAGFFLEGSQVGLRLAIDHPERIRGVVLLAGTAGMVVPGQSYTLEQKVRYQDEQMAPNWFRTVTLRTWNDNNFPAWSYSRDPERAARLFDRVSRGPLPVFIRWLLEFWASDLPSELDRVGVPVLVLSPDFPPERLEDEATRWLSYYFLDSWAGIEDDPRVDRQVIGDAHIFVWLDQPEAVRSAIRAFAAPLGPAADPSP